MKWEKYPFKIEKQYRLPNWDYSNCGYYFITICTKDRENFFGEIKKCKIYLSKIGLIVDFSISQIPIHFPKYVINCYSVMPNHIHLLVENRLVGDSFSRNRPWPVPTGIKPMPQPVLADNNFY
jgi:REP element-mobilizing transposase RayT